MPVTVRNTDILFNDGTTQSTNAGPLDLTAGTSVIGGGLNMTSSTNGGSFVLSSEGVLVRSAGTVTVRMRAIGAADIYAGISIVQAHIFRNGVAVGSALNGNTGNPTAGQFVFSTQNISVSAGDILQFGVRRSGGSWAATCTGSMQVGAGSPAQAGGAVFYRNSFGF